MRLDRLTFVPYMQYNVRQSFIHVYTVSIKLQSLFKSTLGQFSSYKKNPLAQILTICILMTSSGGRALTMSRISGRVYDHLHFSLETSLLTSAAGSISSKAIIACTIKISQ